MRLRGGVQGRRAAGCGAVCGAVPDADGSAHNETVTITVVEPGAALSDAERRRYLRQLVLPQIGEQGQRRLKNARVLVAGAGGLGAPVLMSLAGAGVGRLLIADADSVEVSNLPRQLAFTDAELGTLKAEAAAATARRLNPFVAAVPIAERIDAASAAHLVAEVDLVVDGTDDAATRLALHDAAWARGIPYVWGTAVGTDGMVSVFWRDAPGGPVSLRDLHPDPLVDTGASCAVTGVAGPVTAAVGAMMAGEAMKLIAGYGVPLLGRVQVFDALDATWTEVALAR